MKRRILACVLALIMVVSVLPLTAFAADATCPGKGNDHDLAHCGGSTELAVVKPICGQWGYTVYKCNDCGEKFLDSFSVPNWNMHVYEEIEPKVDATCTVDGKTAHQKCTLCGHEILPTIIKAEHKWVSETLKGNCTTGITYKYTCSVCGEVKIEDGDPAKGHVFEEEKIIIVDEPDWGVAGKAAYECQVEGCGHIKYVVIMPMVCNHGLEHKDYKPETCTENGSSEYWVCDVKYGCGNYYWDEAGKDVVEDKSDIIIPAKHKFEIAESKAETCTEDGYVKYECTECGDGYTEVLGAGHSVDYNNPTDKVEPECEKMGYIVYTCDRCGEIAKMEPIPAAGHSKFEDTKIENIVANPNLSCVNTVTKVWKCNDCGAVQTEDVPAQKHKFETIKVDATCTTYAYEFTYCINPYCNLALKDVHVDNATGREYNVTVGGGKVHFGEMVKIGSDVDELAHNFVPHTYKDPTCLAEGYEYGLCSRCGDMSDIRPIAKLPHTMPEKWTLGQSATCTDNGYEYRICEVCDVYRETKPLLATNHSLNKTVVAPTCVADGYITYECAKCDYTDTEKNGDRFVETFTTPYGSVKEANEHHNLSTDEKDIDVKFQGDCNTVGTYEYKCTLCNEYILVRITGTGTHTVPEDLNTTNCIKGEAPSCTKDGREDAYVCAVCGETFGGGVLPAFEHKLYGESAIVAVPAQDATCTEDGWKAYYECEICHVYFEDANGEKEIEWPVIVGGHKWEKLPDKAPTCTEDGYTDARTCSVCGETKHTVTDAYRATGHSPTLVFTKVGTCLTYGYVHFDCPDCLDENADAEYITDYRPATGHDLVTKEEKATCTEDGYKIVICANGCDYEEYKEYKASGHENADGDVLLDDCTNDVEDRLCVNCNEEIAQSHDLKKVHVDANCLFDYSYDMMSCARCDYYEVLEDTINQEGFGNHKWSAWKTVKADTCTEAGEQTRNCSICGEVQTEVVDTIKTHSWGSWNVKTASTLTKKGVEERKCSLCEAVETREINVKTGIQYQLAVDSDVKSGAAIADSSLIAVKVSVYGSGVGINQSMFTVSYDTEKLDFVRADFTTANFKYDAENNDYEGTVNVMLSALDVDKKTADYNVSAEEDVMVIYFRVNCKIEDGVKTAATKIAIVEDDCITINKSGNKVDTLGAEENVNIVKFLDANGDGYVTLVDVTWLTQMITGEKTYNAAADINKNGEIDADDFAALRSYLLEGASYWDLTRMGVDA